MDRPPLPQLMAEAERSTFAIADDVQAQSDRMRERTDELLSDIENIKFTMMLLLDRLGGSVTVTPREIRALDRSRRFVQTSNPETGEQTIFLRPAK